MVQAALPILTRAVALVACLLALLSCGEGRSEPEKLGLVIHGGVGTIDRSELTPGREQEYRSTLTEALTTGRDLLREGRSSLDVVEAVVRVLEDSPLFNAGKGAVFTSEGTNELDASIMNGDTLEAGAVAAVKHIKNPVSAARTVMERSWHVLMVGESAESFAKQHGIETVPADYFFTERRWEQLQRKKAGEDVIDDNVGTVGAVALDRDGNLAAATSTGGLTNKRFGRVGDSPIVGAGTYADNRSCAVSGTGDGEYFIRGVAAFDVSARMVYGGLPVEGAANAVVHKLTELGGDAGIIAIDREGNVAMEFNTSGMYRGYLDSDGEPVVSIFRDGE